MMPAVHSVSLPLLRNRPTKFADPAAFAAAGSSTQTSAVYCHAVLLLHVVHKLIHEVGPGTSLIKIAEVWLDLLQTNSTTSTVRQTVRYLSAVYAVLEAGPQQDSSQQTDALARWWLCKHSGMRHSMKQLNCTDRLLSAGTIPSMQPRSWQGLLITTSVCYPQLALHKLFPPASCECMCRLLTLLTQHVRCSLLLPPTRANSNSCTHVSLLIALL